MTVIPHLVTVQYAAAFCPRSFQSKLEVRYSVLQEARDTAPIICVLTGAFEKSNFCFLTTPT